MNLNLSFLASLREKEGQIFGTLGFLFIAESRLARQTTALYSAVRSQQIRSCCCRAGCREYREIYLSNSRTVDPRLFFDKEASCDVSRLR
jgi:hypothetical protein